MASVTIHLGREELAAIDKEVERTGVSRHALALLAFRRGWAAGGLTAPQRAPKADPKAVLNRIAHLERQLYKVGNDETYSLEDLHEAFMPFMGALIDHWRAATPKTKARRWDRFVQECRRYLHVCEQPEFLEVAKTWCSLYRPDADEKAVTKKAHALWSTERQRRAAVR